MTKIKEIINSLNQWAPPSYQEAYDNSKLIVKNVNINPSRIGVITILKKMGVKITYKNKRIYKGEDVANIKIQSPKLLYSINCLAKLSSIA